MTPTTSEPPNAVVFKDQRGEYFLFPREALEQGRVPQELHGELERLVADAQPSPDGNGDDTQGYIWPLIWAAEIAIGAAVIIGFSGAEVPPAKPTGPTLGQIIQDFGKPRPPK